MRRSFVTIFCLYALAVSGVAQVAPATKGSNADLRGAKTIYVDTSYDVELEKLVTAHLGKELPELRIVEEPAEAMLVVRFSRSATAERRSISGLSDDEKLRRQSNPDYQPTPRNLTVASRQIQPVRPRAGGAGMSNPFPDPRLDAMVVDDEPRRRAFGEVLRVDGGEVKAIFNFKRAVLRDYDRAARDFVRKLAKLYREENGGK
jgi:hypothetical protein